jgi:transcriptional regulator with XRE-family HTH domain
MSIGERIKAERDRRGWSQSELSRRSGVSQAFISQLEDGKRQELGMKAAQKLARAFEIGIEILLNGMDLTTPPVDLLRAAGYAEETIARVVATWRDWSEKDRLEAVQNAQHELDLATEVARLRQAQESALREKLDAMLLMLSP